MLYTGGLAEQEVFGKIEYLAKDFRKPEGKYLSYNEAKKIAKQNQPYDPTDPEPDFANGLHATVAEKLGLDDYQDLGFYTAVGSVLDYLHGVDGFFEYKTKDKGAIVVTMDITINPRKDSCKADVLIELPTEGLDRKLDRKEYLEKLEEIACSVVEYINLKSADK